jgi:hypothetical protein
VQDRSAQTTEEATHNGSEPQAKPKPKPRRRGKRAVMDAASIGLPPKTPES